MIVSSALTLLLALVALPFLCALVAHASRVIVDGMPCRVAVIRRTLRKCIGRNFRAPKGHCLQPSKGPLARALRFPNMGVSALALALASYKVAQAKCATIRAMIAVDRWIDAPGPMSRMDSAVREWFMNGGLRRAVTAVKVYVASELVPLASRLRRALQPVSIPVRPAATLQRQWNVATGVCEVWQGSRLLGTAVPGPNGPVWFPVPAHRAGKRAVQPC